MSTPRPAYGSRSKLFRRTDAEGLLLQYEFLLRCYGLPTVEAVTAPEPGYRFNTQPEEQELHPGTPPAARRYLAYLLTAIQPGAAAAGGE